MTMETNNTSNAEAEGRPAIDPKLYLLKREIRTYRRELPRLLDEGHESRCVLIKGDEVISVWDTFEDAYQAGSERFGLDVYLAQPIDRRDLARLAGFFPREFDPNETS